MNGRRTPTCRRATPGSARSWLTCRPPAWLRARRSASRSTRPPRIAGPAPTPLAFDAGQTCDLTIAEPKYQDEKGSSRTFSIASPPADAPRVMVATRLTGSAFKCSLLEAADGFGVEFDGAVRVVRAAQERREARGVAGGRASASRRFAASSWMRRSGGAAAPDHALLLEPDTAEHGVPWPTSRRGSGRTPTSGCSPRSPTRRVRIRGAHDVGLMNATFIRPKVPNWATARQLRCAWGRSVLIRPWSEGRRRARRRR